MSVAVLALRPMARALPLGMGALAALIALGSVLALRGEPGPALLVAGVFLAAGAAPVLDDQAAATLDPSVTPRWERRGLRLSLTLPALGCTWLALLAVARLLAPAGAPVPLALATWHWIGMVAVVLTFACGASWLAVPTRDGSVGVAGLLTVLLSDVVVQRLRPSLSLFVLAEPVLSPRVEVRMAGLAVVAVLAFALTSRDPAGA